MPTVARDKSKIEKSKVLPWLPCLNKNFSGDDMPDDLVGAKIIRFGAADEKSRVEGGGLIIDYRPNGTKKTKRVVFGFNDQGMWIER